MKKYLVLALTLMLPLALAWSAEEDVKFAADNAVKPAVDNDGVAFSPVKEGNLLDSSNPIPDPPVITTNILTQDFEEAWDPSVPPTGWTIIDNGSEGRQNWYNQDWHKYYYSSSGFADTVARFYYSPNMESAYDEWLITPDVALPGAATACSLTFKTYYNDNSTSANADSAFVKISADGGGHWTTLITWGSDQGSGTAPLFVNLPVTAYAGQTVRFGFQLATHGSTSYSSANGWYIDKVAIWSDDSSLLSEEFNGWGEWGDNPPTGWSIIDNGTPVGAQGAWNNNDWYKITYWSSGAARVYYTSSYYEWQDEWMISPAFAITAGNACTLSVAEYYYHSTSTETDHGYIKVSTDGGSTWPHIIADHTSTWGSSTKTFFLYGLDAFAGESNLKVAFNFVNEPYGLGDYWYLDDVSIDEYVPPSEDAAVVSIDAPPIMSYTGVNHTITATIENLMADSTIIDSVLFEVDTAGVNVFSNMTYAGVYIQGYASQQFSSSVQWNPTFEYWYVVTVTLYGSGDGFAGNDSRAEYKIMKDVRSYPYVEDMEVATAGDLPMVNFILSGTSGGVYWTSSYSHSPTHCVYFSYSPYPRETAMVFPPVDLSGASAPLLEFFEATYLTYWGDAPDETHTVAIMSGSFDLGNLDTLWSYDPSTWDPWDRGDYANAPPINLDMSAYVGDTVWIVMNYHEPTVDGSYWYLDDVGLKEWPVDDIAATSIDDPVGVVFTGTGVDPKGTFTNLGVVSQTIDAVMIIEDSTSVIYADTVTGVVVDSLGTYQVTFATWNVPGTEGATFDLTLEAINPGDENTADNVIGSSVTAYTHYSTGGPDAYGYYWIDNVSTGDVDPPVYSWIDITTVGQQVTWQTGSVDDGRSIYPLDLPGGFWYYGNFYDSVCIGTNGWAAMVNQTGNYLSNYEPPSTSGPNAGIFPNWDDLDGGTVGSCYYYPDTTNNRFIVSWINWPYYPDPTNPTNFQVILNLGDSTVVMQYGPAADGAYQTDITLGIQDSACTAGLAYYYNGTTNPGNAPFDGLAIKYYFEAPAIDAAMTSVDEPTDGEILFNGTTVTPTVTVTNFGGVATTVDVTYVINDGTSDVYSQTETTALIPGNGGTVQHSFVTTWNADPDGEYDVTAYVVLAGDENSANDTLYTSFDVVTHNSTGGPDEFGYRWIDNIGPGEEDPPVFSWIDLTVSPTADTAGTSSGNLGKFPIGFDFEFYGTTFDSVYINGYGYLQFGASYTSSGLNDCPLPSTTSPYQHMIAGFWDYGYPYGTYDGATIYETFYTPDTFMVVQYHNHRYSTYYNDIDFEIIIHKNGEIVFQYLNVAEEASNYGVGQSATVGLQSDTSGTRYGITYLCNDDPLGNRLVDSLAIKWYIPVFAHDIVADEFIVPATSNGVVNVPFTPEVLFTNNGTSDETNVRVRVIIDPGGYNNDQMIAVLDSGTSYAQTFTQFTPTTGGMYTLTAISELPGDEDPASDTLEMTYYVFDDIFDFESGPGPLIASGGSTGNPPDFNGDWEWGVPYGGTYGPATAYSPTHCWGMVLDGPISTPGYSDTCWSIVDFNLDVGTGNDAIFGYYEWNGLGTSYYDSAFVIANGDTLLVFNGNNEVWHYVSLDLSAYTGIVAMRFYEKKTLSSSSYDGWYFDDFTFINCAFAVGTVDGTVTDANTASPLEGATISANGIPMDVTDISGYYSFDFGPGDVEVEVSKLGYVSDIDTVTVIVNQTTTHNVALGAPIPVIDTSPVIDTVTVGDTAVYNRYLYNTGSAPLIYNVILDFEVDAPLSIRSNAVAERIANVVDPMGHADVAPFSFRQDPPIILDTGDWLFDLDLAHLNDTQILGVEFDDNYYWISAANSGANPNKLYQLMPNGTLVNTFDQPTTSSWGMRDLAWDGEYIYGGDENALYAIDPATGSPVDTIPLPSGLTCIRALAVDPDGYFYSANWASAIYVFDETGTVITTLTNTLSAYGMAYDDISAGGPYLWIYSQDGTPAMTISQYEIATQTVVWSFIGTLNNPPYTDGMAGGACLTTTHPDHPGMAILITATQGTPNDFLSGYEIAPYATWITVQSGGSGEVAVGDSALIEFLIDFRDSTIVIDSTYQADANINNNSAAPTPEIHFAITAAAAGCPYVVGDVNGSDSYNGLDITYGVNYFKGGSDPMCPECPIPDCNTWFYCGDVNGSCSYNGLDITYGVAYFKGGPGPIYCDDCPPADGDAVTVQGKELKPAVQPAVKSKSKLKKGNSLNK